MRRIAFIFLLWLCCVSVGFAREGTQVILTAQERAYLEELGTLTMCVDPDWVPFEHLDDKGNFTGIVADLVSLVALRLGVTIEIIPTADWSESLFLSQQGACMILPFLNQTPKREEWLIFTAPLFTDSNVIITREEHPFIPDLSELVDRTVVLPSGTSIEERVREDFPNLTIILTDTEQEALEMVSHRKADMTIRSLTVAAYTIRQEGYFNLKIAGRVPEYTNLLRMGILKDMVALRDSLDKGIATITPGEREEIVNRHVYIRIEEGIDYTLIWRIVLGFSSLLLVLLLLHYAQKVHTKRIQVLAKALKESEERYLQLLEVSRSVTWEVDREGRYTFVDAFCEALYGYKPEEVVGSKHVYDLAPPSLKETVKISVHDRIQRGEPLVDAEYERVTKDGEPLWVLCNGLALKDKEGKVYGYRGLDTDITYRKQAEKALQDSENRNRSVIAVSNSSAWEYHIAEKRLWFSPEFFQLLGYDPREFCLDDQDCLREFLKNAIHHEDRAVADAAIEQYFGNETEEMLESTYRMLKKDGQCIWVLSRSKRLSQDAIIGAQIDITQIKHAQEALHLEKEQFRTTLMSIGDAVISTDHVGRVRIMNIVAEYLTGFTKKEAEGVPIEEIFSILDEQTRQEKQSPVYKALEEGQVSGVGEGVLLVAKDKMERPIEEVSAPIYDGEGKITGAVLVFRDCTEQRERQREIEYLSFHDVLTGLKNRRFFEQELLRLDEESMLPLTLLMVDVNGLKLTNDAFGHALGDELLQMVSQTLGEICRFSDVVARVGGDEFVILLPKTSEEEASVFAISIRDKLKQKRVQKLPVSVSFGLATKTTKKQSMKEVFTLAEDRMYRDKISHRSSLRHASILIILKTLHEKAPQEEEHAQGVKVLAEAIGGALGFSEGEIQELGLAASLHDIGKIGVRDAILEKESPLTSEDWVAIRKHPETGYSILSSVNDYASIAEHVLLHHERWDGRGYPRGLKGEAISLHARIISVAEAFDAMIRDTPYQKRRSKKEALEEIQRNSRTQFDPKVVDAFLSLMEKEAGL